jgi:hypothetical protein
LIWDKLGREYMAPPPITEHISGPSGGTYTTGDANVPGAPTWVGNASEQITIALDTNSNGSDVEYCIKVEVNGVDGGNIVQKGGTVDTTADVWQTAAKWGSTTAVTGLSSSTSPLPYRFAAKARNVDGTPTAYSAWSEIMLPWVDLAYGPLNTAETYECTTGNTKISNLSGSGMSNIITFTYTLTNKSSTVSRIVAEYSPDNSTWYTATKGAGGDAITALTTSPTGTSHAFQWASCTDMGNSYAATTYFRITPYDASPSGGDAGTAASTTVALDNRPLAVTLADITTGDWDKDTTPVIIATMQSVVCGTALYFVCRVYNNSAVEVQTNSSAERTAGWEYETDTDTWVSITHEGVAAAYANGTNRIRYTVQTALTQGSTFSLKLQQAELRAENY